MKKQNTPWYLPVINLLSGGLFAYLFFYQLTRSSDVPFLILLALVSIFDFITGFINLRRYKEERSHK